ncbi:BlaI/MecI/CopY family transcriptional regulator [Feifania hominis]|uniref:BlaI/MecI/CopY family transcriptional regulator n=1 Tax=Feifania hominis TaxID=2763660 RepID=A0A926DF45_9FIRM|nr:BlaI/MecI/CopY family transcriptional regulator [Feifania hominis]MBC8535875.1 BlaI/MecI/CopY family transcriptional regulator [Feifania hominis]
MEDYKLFDAEFRLMNIIWELEPVNSTALWMECERRLGWKKPTTYTMLRKLCERGMLQNESATVTALVGREQVQRYESEALLEKAFDNSLPSFIATFLKDRKLTKEEAAELERLIREAAK